MIVNTPLPPFVVGTAPYVIVTLILYIIKVYKKTQKKIITK
jgi:hypothetical protein